MLALTVALPKDKKLLLFGKFGCFVFYIYVALNTVDKSVNKQQILELIYRL